MATDGSALTVGDAVYYGELCARRRIGLAAVQAMARHRLARVPYIGATRAVVQRVMDARQRFRLDQRDRRTGGGASPEWVHLAQDVYEVLARAQGHPGA